MASTRFPGTGNGLGSNGSVSIDCDGCAMQHTAVCDDCVVSFLCREERSAKVIDLVEVRALRALAAGGLVPELRHEPTSSQPVSIHRH
ncbi:MAG: hypothetical protein ACKVHU_11295 [Acidimicrobiales bacterium]